MTVHTLRGHDAWHRGGTNCSLLLCLCVLHNDCEQFQNVSRRPGAALSASHMLVHLFLSTLCLRGAIMVVFSLQMGKQRLREIT